MDRDNLDILIIHAKFGASLNVYRSVLPTTFGYREIQISGYLPRHLRFTNALTHFQREELLDLYII